MTKTKLRFCWHWQSLAMIKGFFIGVLFIAFNLMIAFLIINIATGCGMVNSWIALECVTPAQLIGLG
jgi:hypothetical protein